MGKQGPCYHCGVTSTPLWRNGPPEKPVLCNACGSRWRTKGTLANYFPLHSRAEPNDFEDYKIFKVKNNISTNDKVNILKRKQDNLMSEYGGDFNLGLRKGLDEDTHTSNRSSSGSAISNLESCAQYDASDFTEWDTIVPSSKRTFVSRSKQSSVEKLTKELYTIWHEQQSTCISASSEEDLLLESDKSMVSVEIGHGSVLIRHPHVIAPEEEESEASSLSIDNKPKPINEAYSCSKTPPVYSDDKTRKIQKVQKLAGQEMDREKMKRDENQLEKLQLLANHNSPLHQVDQGQEGKFFTGKTDAGGVVEASTGHSKNVGSLGGQHQKFIGSRTLVKIPKMRKLSYGHNDNENSERDLLVDVPCNSSFPQAELLLAPNFASSAVFPHVARP